MNKSLVVLFVVLSVVACTESNPPIDCGDSDLVVLKDTCYMQSESNIPDADYRGVLIEDLTGVRCVACPNAADAAASIKENATTNKVVVLGLYPNDPKSFTTPQKDFPDLRTDAAQLIGTNIFDFSNLLPAGGVNRKVFSGETSVNSGYATWANKANSFEGERSIVNIDLSKEFVDDSTLNIEGVFSFTNSSDYNPFVSIFILENGIKHPQYYSGGTDYDYIHKHVVRKAITPYNGSPLLNGDCTLAERGTVVEKGWQIIIPSNIILENASVVVLINYNAGNSKEVIQCVELKLK
ncbi:MAG: hypothetical protein COA58_07625 [Bacteroidetes bacterium]|nr:MAG: hypothetical protein COA58_07625 [Bacteroidota bacterium]